MRRFLASAFVLLAACGDEAAAPQLEPAPSPTPPSAGAAKPLAVEGWETISANYPLIGATLPGFTAQRLGGGETSATDLRDRWTILGFWSGTAEGAKEEMTYIAALDSAVDQDPDLDFLSVYLPSDDGFDVEAWGAGAGAWPTIFGDDKLLDIVGIEGPPAYLLIGPDLTIEAYRGALSKTPENGIKPVIRGVAQIKKQIAAP